MTTMRAGGYGIREVSELTGLSVDSLRWYEREGLVPAVARANGGHRRYDDRTVTLVMLVVTLRRTGMSVADTRSFVQLVAQGARSHGRRMHLLERHREAIREQQIRLGLDLAAVERKIDHYGGLIERGLDCDGLPVDAATAEMQRRTS